MASIKKISGFDIRSLYRGRRSADITTAAPTTKYLSVIPMIVKNFDIVNITETPLCTSCKGEFMAKGQMSEINI